MLGVRAVTSVPAGSSAVMLVPEIVAATPAIVNEVMSPTALIPTTLMF